MSEFENSDRQLTVYNKQEISNIFEIKVYVVYCWNSKHPLIRTQWFKCLLAENFPFNTQKYKNLFSQA